MESYIIGDLFSMDDTLINNNVKSNERAGLYLSLS